MQNLLGFWLVGDEGTILPCTADISKQNPFPLTVSDAMILSAHFAGFMSCRGQGHKFAVYTLNIKQAESISLTLSAALILSANFAGFLACSGQGHKFAVYC